MAVRAKGPNQELLEFKNELHCEFFNHFEMDGPAWRAALQWAKTHTSRSYSSNKWAAYPNLDTADNFHQLANHLL